MALNRCDVRGRRRFLSILMLLVCSSTLTSSTSRAREDQRNFAKQKHWEYEDNSIMEHINVPLVQKMLLEKKREVHYNTTFLQHPPVFKDDGNRSRIPATSPDVLTSSREAQLSIKSGYLKNSWCRRGVIRQRFKMRGCLSLSVVNRFCYGQCNSFFIPHERLLESTGRAGHGGTLSTRVFESCSACRPHVWRRSRVQFQCPRHPRRVRRKWVRLVAQCKCRTIRFKH